MVMDAALLIRSARRQSHLSLRALAARAGTSHATLSAYEKGRVDPTTTVLSRIIAAAGQSIEATLLGAPPDLDDLPRGQELRAVLELAEQFPARHAPRLEFPVFPSP
jgi:transcriptional regulator with XRE-family HTH domain